MNTSTLEYKEKWKKGIDLSLAGKRRNRTLIYNFMGKR